MPECPPHALLVRLASAPRVLPWYECAESRYPQSPARAPCAAMAAIRTGSCSTRALRHRDAPLTTIAALRDSGRAPHLRCRDALRAARAPRPVFWMGRPGHATPAPPRPARPRSAHGPAAASRRIRAPRHAARTSPSQSLRAAPSRCRAARAPADRCAALPASARRADRPWRANGPRRQLKSPSNSRQTCHSHSPAFGA